MILNDMQIKRLDHLNRKQKSVHQKTELEPLNVHRAKGVSGRVAVLVTDEQKKARATERNRIFNEITSQLYLEKSTQDRAMALKAKLKEEGINIISTFDFIRAYLMVKSKFGGSPITADNLLDLVPNRKVFSGYFQTEHAFKRVTCKKEEKALYEPFTRRMAEVCAALYDLNLEDLQAKNYHTSMLKMALEAIENKTVTKEHIKVALHYRRVPLEHFLKLDY